MSLIYFHIFLMSTGVLFSFGFALWEFSNFGTSHKIVDLLTAAGSFVFGVALFIYLVWFIKKKKPQMNRS